MQHQVVCDLTIGRIDENLEPLPRSRVEFVLERYDALIRRAAQSMTDWLINEDYGEDGVEDDCIREFCRVDAEELVLIFEEEIVPIRFNVDSLSNLAAETCFRVVDVDVVQSEGIIPESMIKTIKRVYM
jgi:hypothetical protein